MDKQIATLEKLMAEWLADAANLRRAGVNAPWFDQGQASSLERCADNLRAAIALMRGQSEPVADAAGKDAFLALADSLDCFWNASLGATHPYDDATANAVMSGMVQGFAAVAFRLREHANTPKDPADDQ